MFVLQESGVEEFCQEIFAKWNQCNSTSAKNQQNGATQKVIKVENGTSLIEAPFLTFFTNSCYE